MTVGSDPVFICSVEVSERVITSPSFARVLSSLFELILMTPAPCAVVSLKYGGVLSNVTSLLSESVVKSLKLSASAPSLVRCVT